MRSVLSFLFVLFSLSLFAQVEQSSPSMKERLGVPYGTIVEIEARVLNGDDLGRKVYMGHYLLEVLKVNNKKVKDSFAIFFKDETGEVPEDNFQLYKYLNGEETGGLSLDEIEEIQKEYVGKKIKLMVYESGMFVGAPDGYFDYQPQRATTGFYFRHYLIVVQRK